MNRIETLVSILVSPLQRFENACIQLLTQRFVSTAVGVQLDVLGKIVGQARVGLSDDVYRRYISARIATNRATGKREELLSIARLILNDLTADIIIRTEGGATLILEVRGITVDADVQAALIEFLGAAAATGVRIVVVSSESALASTFRFDVGPGFDVGHLAAGSDNATAT